MARIVITENGLLREMASSRPFESVRTFEPTRNSSAQVFEKAQSQLDILGTGAFQSYTQYTLAGGRYDLFTQNVENATSIQELFGLNKWLEQSGILNVCALWYSASRNSQKVELNNSYYKDISNVSSEAGIVSAHTLVEMNEINAFGNRILFSVSFRLEQAAIGAPQITFLSFQSSRFATLEFDLCDGGSSVEIRVGNAIPFRILLNRPTTQIQTITLAIDNNYSQVPTIECYLERDFITKAFVLPPDQPQFQGFSGPLYVNPVNMMLTNIVCTVLPHEHPASWVATFLAMAATNISLSDYLNSNNYATYWSRTTNQLIHPNFMARSLQTTAPLDPPQVVGAPYIKIGRGLNTPDYLESNFPLTLRSFRLEYDLTGRNSPFSGELILVSLFGAKINVTLTPVLLAIKLWNQLSSNWETIASVNFSVPVDVKHHFSIKINTLTSEIVCSAWNASSPTITPAQHIGCASSDERISSLFVDSETLLICETTHTNNIWELENFSISSR